MVTAAEMTTDANSFTNARVESAGSVRGLDEIGHDIFKVVRREAPTLYGDYFYLFDSTGFNFNIEIRQFGNLDWHAMGDLDPAYREHFSAEEASAAEQLIRAYFLSNPPVYARMHGPDAKFLGGVLFRPNWIIQKPSGAR